VLDRLSSTEGLLSWLDTFRINTQKKCFLNKLAKIIKWKSTFCTFPSIITTHVMSDMPLLTSFIPSSSLIFTKNSMEGGGIASTAKKYANWLMRESRVQLTSWTIFKTQRVVSWEEELSASARIERRSR